MISVRFQGKPFNITVIQVYIRKSNAEEAEQFCEDLQDLLEPKPQKDVLFIIGDWNTKVGSQEMPGATGKFGLAVQNEAGQICLLLQVSLDFLLCILVPYNEKDIFFGVSSSGSCRFS